MTNSIENAPEGANLTDLFIYPHMYLDEGVKIVDRELSNYGYISNELPGKCNFCVEQIISPGLRPKNWYFDCPDCGNWIIFQDISALLNVLCGRDRKIKKYWEQVNARYRQKSSVWLKKEDLDSAKLLASSIDDEEEPD